MTDVVGDDNIYLSIDRGFEDQVIIGIDGHWAMAFGEGEGLGQFFQLRYQFFDLDGGTSAVSELLGPESDIAIFTDKGVAQEHADFEPQNLDYDRGGCSRT
jgi:hypothetical protein